MRSTTYRLIAVTVILNVSGLSASCIYANPTETPNATPTQEVYPGLLPNFKFVKTDASLQYKEYSYQPMTVNPYNGDIYCLTPYTERRSSHMRAYDGATFQQKDSFRIYDPPNSHWRIWSERRFVADRKGNLYFCSIGNDDGEQSILTLPKNSEILQIYHECLLPTYQPITAILPIEKDAVPPGVPGQGMLFMIKYVDGGKWGQTGIYFIDEKEPDREARRIATFPEKIYNDRRNQFVLGPNNQLFVMTEHQIYRLEPDSSLKKMMGYGSPFYPGAFNDLAYDSTNDCFYSISRSTLFRMDSNFESLLAVNDIKHPFPCLQIEYSKTIHKPIVVRGGKTPSDNDIYVLESVSPYPTPTNTPTPPPPISTYRPTVFPTDPAGNPVALVPYVGLRLVAQTHPNVQTLAVHPITNDLYYHYHEYQPASWTDADRHEFNSIVRGPIHVNEGYTPLTLQPVFSRYKNSPPYSKRAVVGEDDCIYMPYRNSVRLDGETGKEELNLYAQEMIYVCADNRFLNVPQGSILFYAYYNPNRNPPYVFKYIDPSDDAPTVRTIQVPAKTDAQLREIGEIHSFFWGPKGMLHFSEFYSLYRFEMDGSISLVREKESLDNAYNTCEFFYLPKDESYYFFANSHVWPYPRLLFRLPENENTPQPVLSFQYDSPYLVAPSADGAKLYLTNNADCKIWEFEPHFTPGVPVATPTPTPPPGTPTPTPTPMDWMMLDGYGGIHVSRPEVKKPNLPYFQDFDIARDLEPDPLGRGWYMLDGYGGVHLSSPDLPRPDGLPYFQDNDVARDLEILERDGELTFVVMDGFGRLYAAGAHAADVNLDAPPFAKNMARDLEPAPGGGWLVMDAYGALFDSRDRSVSVAAGTYWLDAWFARDLTVFPDGATLMIDSYGGRHYQEGKSPLDRLYPIPAELYFLGKEIVWDFEYINN